MSPSIPMSDSNASASAAPATKSFARFVPHIVRVLAGLLFLVTGLNVFLNFIPQPQTPLPEKAMAFAGALFASGYMMPLIGGTLTLVGALLVLNRFVPLALALIAPFIVNSVAFHIFLEPTGRVMSGICAALVLFLAWSYRGAYRPMLKARVSPGA